MKDTLPPKFQPWRAPEPEGLKRQENRGRHRISPRKRGYNARWDRISIALRRSRPWCLFCQQTVAEDRWQMTAVADHILPAHEFPHLRYSGSNLVPLCAYHHDKTKQELENYARTNNCLEDLVGWVRYPMTRPAHLRPIALDPGWAAIAAGLGWSEPPAS